MKNPNDQLVLPPKQPPPDLEEYLDPKPFHTNSKCHAPGSNTADDNLKHALSLIAADGYNPWAEPFIIDVDKSEEWRSNHHVRGRVPCLTHSTTRGFWVTNRDRIMSVAEGLRIQGISPRQIA